MRKKNIWKLLVPVFLLAAILTGYVLILPAIQQRQEISSQASAANTLLTMITGATTLQIGQMVTVTQIIDTGDNTVSAAELHLTYPANLLQVQSVTAGNFLPVVLTPGYFNNGEASIILGCQPDAPKKGTGALATVTFKALQYGTATVAFANTTQVAAIGSAGNVATLGPAIQLSIPAPANIPNTTLRLILNLQGLNRDRGTRKMNVVVSRGPYESRFSNLDARWSASDSAYLIVTPPLIDGNLVTASDYVVSVKEAARLRRRFTGVTITRGAANTMIRKSAGDTTKAGDVNGDNKINVLDFAEMVRQGNFTGLSTPTTEATRKYDLNGDGYLTAADISLLLANYTQLEVPGDPEK